MALETLKTQFLVKIRQRAGPGVCLSFIAGCQETSMVQIPLRVGNKTLGGWGRVGFSQRDPGSNA